MKVKNFGAGWLCLAFALVATPLPIAGAKAQIQLHTDSTPAELIAAAEWHCEQLGRPLEQCMAAKRAESAAWLDQMAAQRPRLVAHCEAEHPDPIVVATCAVLAISTLPR